MSFINNDQLREVGTLYLSASTYATAQLTDFINEAEGCVQKILVRVVGELGYAALLVASLVEGVVRAILIIPSLALCVLTEGECNSTNWCIDTAGLTFANAYQIVTQALVENLFASQVRLYPSELTAEDKRIIAEYEVLPAHIAQTDILQIPQVTDPIDVPEVFNKFFKSLQPLGLLDNVDDDDQKLTSTQFSERCNKKFDVAFFPKDEAVRDALSEKSKKFVNVLKHVMLTIQNRWNFEVNGLDAGEEEMVMLHIASQLPVTALSPEQLAAVQCIRDLANIMRKTGAAILHCSNRTGTDGDDLYWEFVVTDPSFIEKKTLNYRVRCALATLRHLIFYTAVERICDAGRDFVHRAASHSYYRRTQAATYGVPADTAKLDRAHENFAVKGYEYLIRQEFDREHHAASMVKCLKARVNSTTETLVIPALFAGWFTDVYQGEDEALDSDGKYTDKAILAYLEHEGLIRRRILGES